MAKPKQFAKPPKKQKNKPVTPQTEAEFQEAADLEEETGGKWRAGDPAKSGRAFVRALDIYEKGLEKYPKSFDLAYNKARLELEITQRPALVAHIGLPLVDLLKQTLASHRTALRLNEENPDILFNTSQVLTAIAEQLSETGDSENAIPLLQEALEHLSACLSRQEMLIEQQQAGFEDTENGGVALDPEETPASTTGSDDSDQMATIETPITATDLLDTVHASVSALTTIVSLAEMKALQTYGNLAHTLTESKAPEYIALLPADARDAARFTVGVDRANFIAAFADAQYNADIIDAETYLVRLDAFDVPGKENDPIALSSEAEARTEFVLSVLARFEGSPQLPIDACWKQLSIAQDLYAKAAKLEASSQVFLSRGDVEMLRHRIATLGGAKVSEGVRKSAPTLAQNAQTYYRGAGRLAGDDEADLKTRAQQRMLIAAELRALIYGIEPSSDPVVPHETRPGLIQALADCVEGRLLDAAAADGIAHRLINW